MFITKHLLALVALAVGAASSCDVCSDELYDGKCGGLSQEAKGKWDDWMVEGLETLGCVSNVCCASNEDDCCEANVGAIVGLVIGLVVVLGGSIFACCKFCPGCPMNKDGGKPAKRSSAPPVQWVHELAQSAQASGVRVPWFALVAVEARRGGGRCGSSSAPSPR